MFFKSFVGVDAHNGRKRQVPQALDSALEGEWNDLLDRCKLEAPPPPAADVSLGVRLRHLVRERADW